MPVTDKKREVTVVLPGLMNAKNEAFRPFLQALAKQGERLYALELMLSRAHQYVDSAFSFESLLFGLFAMDCPVNQDVPVAAMNWLLYHGESSPQWMMRADPVYVQPNRDHLLMMGNDMLQISDEEAQRLVGDINDTFADTDWQLHSLSPMHWVIQSSHPLALKTHPLLTVLGKNISTYLPYGDDSGKWHAVMNELQMFLYGHPVNREREGKGLPTINSIWLWGGGVLPDKDKRGQNSGQTVSWAQCWSNNPIALALAKMKQVPRVDLPSDANAWLTQAITGGGHLLVLDDLHMPMEVMDPYQWWQELVRVNQQWLHPLVVALQQGSIARLEVITDAGERYELTPSLAKRWWKRVRALSKS